MSIQQAVLFAMPLRCSSYYYYYYYIRWWCCWEDRYFCQLSIMLELLMSWEAAAGSCWSCCLKMLFKDAAVAMLLLLFNAMPPYAAAPCRCQSHTLFKGQLFSLFKDGCWRYAFHRRPVESESSHASCRLKMIFFIFRPYYIQRCCHIIMMPFFIIIIFAPYYYIIASADAPCKMRP